MLGAVSLPGVVSERAATGSGRVAAAWSRLRVPGAAVAGPLLIVAAVLVVLHDVVFGGRISAQHVDPLAQFLPSHCFLGTSLGSGHPPLWNPGTLAGHPYAADPQSG